MSDTHAEAQAQSDVDLSDLFTFNPTKLSLALNLILERIAKLESVSATPEAKKDEDGEKEDGGKDGEKEDTKADADTHQSDDDLKDLARQINDLKAKVAAQDQRIGELEDANKVGAEAKPAEEKKEESEKREEAAPETKDEEKDNTKADEQAATSDEPKNSVDDDLAKRLAALEEQQKNLGDEQKKQGDRLGELADKSDKADDQIGKLRDTVRAQGETQQNLADAINSRSADNGENVAPVVVAQPTRIDHQDDIDRIDKHLKVHDTAIEELKDALKNMGDDLDKKANAEDVKPLAEAIAEQKDALKDLKGARSDDGNSHQDAAKNDDLQKLANRVGPLERQINDLRGKVASLEDRPAATSNAGDAQPRTADDDLAGLGDALKRLHDLNRKIEGMEADIQARALADDLEPVAAQAKVLDEAMKNAQVAIADHADKLQRMDFDCRPDVKDLQSRMNAIDSKLPLLDELPTRTKDLARRVSENEADVDRLKTQAADTASGLQGLKDDINILKSKLDAIVFAPGSGDGAANAPAIALLNAGLTELQKIVDAHTASIGQLEPKVADLDRQAGLLQKQQDETSGRTDKLEGDGKAMRGDITTLGNDLAALQKQLAQLKTLSATPAQTAAPAALSESGLDELRRRIAGNTKAIEQHSDRLAGLQADKAPLSAIAAIKAEIDKLRDLLGKLEKKSDGAGSSMAQGGPATAEVESRIADIAAAAADSKKWAEGEVLEIKATIEHIHLSKADTTLVANKAERDYVENALEKLMREVEQVINQTNAGLIDTLDKSLGLLRDMIDGRATKADLAKLKAMLGDGLDQGGTGNVPDGLAGYKSYRCLGCNRTVDAMRVRPMGSNFATFMNRVPNAKGPGQGSIPPRPPGTAGSSPAIQGSSPAGYIADTPYSA